MEVSTSTLLDKAHQTSARYRLECLQCTAVIDPKDGWEALTYWVSLASKTSQNTPKKTFNIWKSLKGSPGLFKDAIWFSKHCM